MVVTASVAAGGQGTERFTWDDEMPKSCLMEHAGCLCATTSRQNMLTCAYVSGFSRLHVECYPLSVRAATRPSIMFSSRAGRCGHSETREYGRGQGQGFDGRLGSNWVHRLYGKRQRLCAA